MKHIFCQNCGRRVDDIDVRRLQEENKRLKNIVEVQKEATVNICNVLKEIEDREFKLKIFNNIYIF